MDHFSLFPSTDKITALTGWKYMRMRLLKWFQYKLKMEYRAGCFKDPLKLIKIYRQRPLRMS